jgi:hypothetical protein
MVDDLVDLVGQLACRARRFIASSVVKTSSPMTLYHRQRLLRKGLHRLSIRACLASSVGLNSFLDERCEIVDE